MGTRTAGAGGYVHSVEFPPNMLGLSGFRLTGSLAERANAKPIENLGVTPDVPYALGVDDMHNGYQPYVKAIDALIQSRFMPAIVNARKKAASTEGSPDKATSKAAVEHEGAEEDAK